MRAAQMNRAEEGFKDPRRPVWRWLSWGAFTHKGSHIDLSVGRLLMWGTCIWKPRGVRHQARELELLIDPVQFTFGPAGGNQCIPCSRKVGSAALSEKVKSESRSVVSGSLGSHGLHSPRNSPGQNTGVGFCSLLQGIFLAQGSNPGLPHCRWILYQLSHQGKCIFPFLPQKAASLPVSLGGWQPSAKIWRCSVSCQLSDLQGFGGMQSSGSQCRLQWPGRSLIQDYAQRNEQQGAKRVRFAKAKLLSPRQLFCFQAGKDSATQLRR